MWFDKLIFKGELTLSEKKSLRDPFSGGRHLNAITHSKNLNTLEKFFMLNLGAMMDFRDIIHSSRYVSYTKMADLMSCSIKTIQRISVSLRTRGYINVENRFGEDDRQQSNVYSLTDLVFEEYCAKLWPDSQSGGGGTDSPTNLPQKEVPNKSSLSKDKDVCAHAHAPNQNCEDQIVEVPIEEEIKPRAPKRKARPRKPDRPKVTQSHQKIARIFAPDSRFVKNTYWDKGSLFFRVDEFLEKQGESGHQVIDMLYRHCKERDICGRKPFDLATVDLLLREAVNEFTRTLGVDNEQT